MSPIDSGALLALGLLALRVIADDPPAYPTCESYGVDFQDQGFYFQNRSSTDPFTFISIFEKCQDDTAYNILVDPNGDEYQCSDTAIQPDDTNQLSTCPLNKNEMWSGAWSVIIMSNNGQADPIGYEREFDLLVDLPRKSTYTPIVWLSSTTTPLKSTTSTLTTTSTSTSLSTTIVPARTRTPTRKITPAASTTTKTWVLGTVKSTAYEVTPVVITKTKTQKCSVSTQTYADPPLTYTPSLLPPEVASSFMAADPSAASATTSSPPKLRRKDTIMRRVPADRVQRIAKRKKRLADSHKKRGLDVAFTTVTDLNTANYPTSTSTITAPTSTIVITTLVTQLQTIVQVTTVLSGTTTLPTVTTTLPNPTKTALKVTLITQVVSIITKRPKITLIQTTALPAAASICSVKGGSMV